MKPWRAQLFFRQGLQQGIDRGVLERARAVGQQTVAVSPDLPPLFSLRHIAYSTEVEYGFLRGIVRRKIETPYTVFTVRKATGHDFRRICVPMPDLMRVQRWIARRILVLGKPHDASVAYARGSSVIDAAKVHCNCRWLIKLDIRRFFESVSEIAVYRSFRRLGYQPLLSFELARLTTMLEGKVRGDAARWRSKRDYSAISLYSNSQIGHLPQGAPTSPMLANLAVADLDDEIAAIANRHDLAYTRYADDICLSTRSETFSREQATAVIGEVYRAISRAGLSPNIAKTRIAPPGARKVVLGLNVDRGLPTLSREFRDSLRQHLHFISRPDCGPVSHAQRRGFVSVLGLRDHIQGLIGYASQVDPAFSDQCRQIFEGVTWPIL